MDLETNFHEQKMISTQQIVVILPPFKETLHNGYSIKRILSML